MNEVLSSEAVSDDTAVAANELTSDPVSCPRCRSKLIETRNYAKKIGGVLGAATGLGSGVAVQPGAMLPCRLRKQGPGIAGAFLMGSRYLAADAPTANS